MPEIFKPNDAVSAKLGKCYVIIDGVRELWLHVKSIEVKATIDSTDVPRLGSFVKGSRATGMAYSGTMTIYKVNPRVDNIIQQMADTGLVPYFDIQTVNEDPTAKNGRDVKLIKDCHLDGDIVIAAMDGDGEFLEQEVGFNAGGVQPLEKFNADTSIIAG
jgi:hypothetical protein